MNEKLFLLILFLGWDFYFLLIVVLSILSDRRPVPEHVRDIAASDDFLRRKTGHELSMKFLIKSILAFSAVIVLLIVLDLPKVWHALILDSALAGMLAGLGFVGLGLLCLGLVFRHFLLIRERYGTGKEEWKDLRKSYFLFCAAVLLLCLVFFIWRRASLQKDLEMERGSLGMILLVMAAVFVCFAVGAAFVLFRRTEPLPEGKLADGVWELIQKSGIRHCSVRIKRIEESRKINGGCMKLPGRTVIFLHCCPEKEEDIDLVLAVAGHELGHGVQVSWGWKVFFTALAFLPLILPSVMLVPWFEKVNLLFCYLIFLPALIFAVFRVRRRWESDADAYAVKLGIAESAVRLFRIYLVEDSYELLNPYPLLTAMTCMHPPLSQRIAAIERQNADKWQDQ